MIERWSRWVVGHRWWVIGLSVVLTVVALGGMRRLYFSNRLMEWLPKDDPLIARHLDVSEKFSVNNMVLILIKPRDGVFRADFLQKVKDLTERLKESEGVMMVTSMGNASDIRKIPGGIEVANLLDEIPETELAMQELRQKVLGKDIFRNRIVSGDGEWLALSAFIASDSDQIYVVKTAIIPETEKALGGEGECFFTGMPAETYFINQFVGRDLATLVPVALLLILVILFFTFRSWQGVVFPMLVVVMSTVWLFGLIGYLGSPLTIVSPVIPVVIFALGSAYGIHVLNRLTFQFREEGGRSKNENIVLGVRLIFVPLVLAGVTDMVGFLTFKSARLSVFADFGLFTAMGLLLAMIAALALVPALATFTDFNRLQRERNKHGLNKVLARLGKFAVQHRKLLLGLSLGTLLCFTLALTLLKLEVSFAKFYPSSSLPRRSMEAANAHFDGAYPLAISIETDRVRSSENLRVLRRLQNFMYSLPGTSQPFAITDFIQELNWQLNDRYAIPDRDAAVGNLWFFVEGRDELNQLLTADDRESVIFAKISNPYTDFNKKLYRQINDFLAHELRNGYVSYQRRALAPEQRQPLVAAQVSCLSQELAWLAQRYVPGRAERTAIEEVLRAEPWQALPFAAVREKAKAVLWEYIAVDDFEFELSLPQKKHFLDSLLAALEKGSAAEELRTLMAHWLPVGVYDAPIAADLAATLCYKVDEAGQQLQVDAMWRRLSPLFGSADPNFEKKARSILFDLTAEVVVLPSPTVSLPGAPGNKIPVTRIDQTGYPLMMSKMDQFLLASLLQSILLCYVLTLVLMTLMRRSLPLGLISTLPIIFTSIVMFGLLALIGIPLDYATMMIGGVSIGVGIDYAIHFIHGYISERDAGFPADEAIRRAFLDKGQAILTNALSVMAGFAVLLLSSLMPLRNFAWAMVCSMFLAALAALTLLPAAILVFNPKVKK